MIGFKIDQAKSFFFDNAITNSLDKATKKALSKFGAYVRKTARTSIVKRKGASAVGSPPASHTGLLKRFIFFVFDPSRQSVIVGPALLNSVASRGALAALEHGGTSTTSAGSHRISARPFMQPALETNQGLLAGMFKDSMRP